MQYKLRAALESQGSAPISEAVKVPEQVSDKRVSTMPDHDEWMEGADTEDARDHAHSEWILETMDRLQREVEALKPCAFRDETRIKALKEKASIMWEGEDMPISLKGISMSIALRGDYGGLVDEDMLLTAAKKDDGVFVTSRKLQVLGSCLPHLYSSPTLLHAYLLLLRKHLIKSVHLLPMIVL